MIITILYKDGRFERPDVSSYELKNGWLSLTPTINYAHETPKYRSIPSDLIEEVYIGFNR